MGASQHVGDMKQPYTKEPQCEFQRRLRRPVYRSRYPSTTRTSNEDTQEQEEASEPTMLYNHVTRPFNSINVERICRVEMKACADHHSLPEKLKPWCLSAKDSAAARHNGWKGLYGRLDPMRHFSTALTEMSPMGKSGTVIHPNQARVLTVRECARAQGFPDHYIFHSVLEGDTRDMYRQIGNAVPPPLVYHLGKELRRALMKDFEEFHYPLLGSNNASYSTLSTTNLIAFADSDEEEDPCEIYEIDDDLALHKPRAAHTKHRSYHTSSPPWPTSKDEWQVWVEVPVMQGI